MNHLLLTGATGRLGRTVQRVFTPTWVIHPRSRSGGDDLRTASPGDVVPEEADFVLNCAAMSSRGGCSRDSFSAYALNTRWPARLAGFCAASNRRLVHISTDLVYSGGIPPYKPRSPAVPRSLYGWTKLLGDRAVLSRAPSACVVRTSVLIGTAGAPTPTFTEDILSGRATTFHVDSFRNHTDIDALASYLEGCLLSSSRGLVIAAAPYSTSRAAYAYSLLHRDINLAFSSEGDLTLKPSVNLTNN